MTNEEKEIIIKGAELFIKNWLPVMEELSNR